jgi:hypothetical protein
MIQNKYSGPIKELLLQIKELENKLTLMDTTIYQNCIILLIICA